MRTFENPRDGGVDHFGRSVSAVGNNVLVGAPKEDFGSNDLGAAYLLDGSSGTLLHTLETPLPDGGLNFGVSVAGVGNNVLVGGLRDYACLFSGTSGKLLHTYYNPTPEAGDRFGRTVAARGEDILVGAYWNDTGATDSGTAYLFEPIPEPSTFILAAIGLLSLVFYRHRRRR